MRSSNKEEKINDFLDELFSEKSPSYVSLEKDDELVEIAEISLLLKEGIKKSENFKEKLFVRLSGEFEKENGKFAGKRHKSILFNALSVGLSLSLFILVLNPFLFSFHKKNLSLKNSDVKRSVLKQDSKADIVKITSYRISSRKTLRLLYNERNNVILYWPFGQLAIFQ